MLSSSEKVETHQDKPDSAAVEKRHKRRSHHKKPGTLGKVLVLLMAFLIVACIGLSAFLSFQGQPHPLIANWGGITRLVTHGLFAAVILLCLSSLYRGSASIKHLFSVCGVLAALTFAVLVTLDVLHDAPTLWIAFDSFALAVAVFTAWICLFSRSASRFISLQTDKPH